MLIPVILAVNIALQAAEGRAFNNEEKNLDFNILPPIIHLQADNDNNQNSKGNVAQTTTIKSQSTVSTLIQNDPPVPGDNYNIKGDANHYVTKHNLNDNANVDVQMQTEFPPIICENMDMYRLEFPNFHRDMDVETSFDALKKRVDSFAGSQQVQEEKNVNEGYYRNADASPHFALHHHHHQHPFINKNVHININKHHDFHQDPHHVTEDFMLPHLNPVQHHHTPQSSITINKQHNTFASGPTHIQHNIQVARETAPAKDGPFDVDNLQSPYLIFAPHFKHYRYRRTNTQGKRFERETDGKSTNNPKRGNKRKRSVAVPLIQLIADPNKKLDMAKTIDNIGTITRKSFHNKKAPMYHLRNMLGSAKDVLVSSMRVVPQDFLIPTQYKIMDKKTPEYEAFVSFQQQARNNDNNETVVVGAAVVTNESNSKPLTLIEKLRRKLNLKPRFGASSTEDALDYEETFKKVGTLFRNSILASQNTLNHVGETAHSARKAVTTAKLAAPTILLPYAKAPALMNGPNLLSRSAFDEQPDKMVLIAPRIFEIEEDKNEPHPADFENEFLQFGQLTDALGFTKPHDKRIDLATVVLHHKMTPKPPVLQSRMQLRTNLETGLINNTQPYFWYSEIHSPDFDDEEEVDTTEEPSETISTPQVESATEEPPVDLQELIVQMKEEFDTIRSDIDALKERVNETKSFGFNLNLKPMIPPLRINELIRNNTLLTTTAANSTANIPTSKREVHELKRASTRISTLLEKLLRRRPEKAHGVALTDDDIDNIIETNIQDVFGPPQSPLTDNPLVGVGIPLGPNLFKPFMGQPSEDELKGFLEENHDDMKLLPELEGKEELESNEVKGDGGDDEIVGAINPVMYKKYFNEPLKLKSTNNGSGVEENVGFKMPKKLLKPFLGEVDYDVVYDFGDIPARYDDFEVEEEEEE